VTAVSVPLPRGTVTLPIADLICCWPECIVKGHTVYNIRNGRFIVLCSTHSGTYNGMRQVARRKAAKAAHPDTGGKTHDNGEQQG
jgi:hypothetical protein